MDEVFGLPVTGNVGHYSHSPKEQKPLSDLEPVFRALLEDEQVARFGWVQYTPYFNDGEACIFGVSSPYVVPVKEVNQEDPMGLDEDPDFDRWEYEVKFPWRNEPGSPEHHQKFAEMIDSGHYDVALESTFGDPAHVIVSRDGIKIEFFEHD